jgi:hypothetical protein
MCVHQLLDLSPSITSTSRSRLLPRSMVRCTLLRPTLLILPLFREYPVFGKDCASRWLIPFGSHSANTLSPTSSKRDVHHYRQSEKDERKHAFLPSQSRSQHITPQSFPSVSASRIFRCSGIIIMVYLVGSILMAWSQAVAESNDRLCLTSTLIIER